MTLGLLFRIVYPWKVSLVFSRCFSYSGLFFFLRKTRLNLVICIFFLSSKVHMVATRALIILYIYLSCKRIVLVLCRKTSMWRLGAPTAPYTCSTWNPIRWFLVKSILKNVKSSAANVFYTIDLINIFLIFWWWFELFWFSFSESN